MLGQPIPEFVTRTVLPNTISPYVRTDVMHASTTTDRSGPRRVLSGVSLVWGCSGRLIRRKLRSQWVGFIAATRTVRIVVRVRMTWPSVMPRGNRADEQRDSHRGTEH